MYYSRFYFHDLKSRFKSNKIYKCIQVLNIFTKIPFFLNIYCPLLSLRYHNYNNVGYRPIHFTEYINVIQENIPI